MKPRLRESLAVVELDGEAVIYDDDGGNLHHLNPTATIVMSLCDGTSTVRDMAADIAAAFDLSPAEIEKQVRALLRDFRKSGLLEGSPPGTMASRAKDHHHEHEHAHDDEVKAKKKLSR